MDVIPPNTLVDGIPSEEMARFIGPESTKYIARFMDMDRKQSKLSWNWAAAIFGPIWLFYRKMYKAGLLYILLLAVITVLCIPRGTSEFISSFIELFVSGFSTGNPPDYNALMSLYESMPLVSMWQSVLSYVFSIGATVLFGLFGNTLYRRKVKTSILQIRTQCDSMMSYNANLAQKGGVSVLLPVLYIICKILFSIFFTVGFAYLFHI